MSIPRRILLVANIAALFVFLGMAFLLPLHGQSEAESRFKEFRDNPASRRSSEAGASDATYIVEPALSSLRAATNVGIALTLLDSTLLLFDSVSQTKKKKS